MSDVHPPIYSDSIDNVYVYDYGHTVEVVNWNEYGRKMFFRKQGIHNPWTIIKIINDNVLERNQNRKIEEIKDALLSRENQNTLINITEI